MIDTTKLIPQRKQSERLSGKTFVTIGLIKKDVVKIDSLLKEKLVISKVRYGILRKQNERDKRSRRESILESKKSRPQDYDTNLKSNKKGKGFGGILGGIIKALLAGIGFTIFKSLPALLKIGKIIKIIAAPLILGATVLLGGIARLATAGSKILPDVRGKNFEGASSNSITNGIENFKGALIGAAVAFAGGALGGAITSRLVRGKTFTEKEAAQQVAKGFKVKKGKVTGDEVFMTKDGKITKTRPADMPFDEVLPTDQKSRKSRKIIKKISDIETFDDARLYQEQMSEVGGTSTVTKKPRTPKKITKKSFVEELGLDPKLEKFGTEVPGAAKTRPIPLNKGIYGSPEVDQFFNQITNNKTFNNNPILRTKVDNDFQLFLNARNPSVKRRRLTQLLNSLRSGGVSTLDINRLSTILTFSAFKPIDPSALTKSRPTKKRRGRPKKLQTIEEIKADIDARNPTFVSPETGGRLPVKRTRITASKLAKKKGLSKLLFNLGGEAFEQSVKQTIKAGVGTVPIIGDLIGFLLDVFLFGQPVGRAAFMALGSFVGSLIGGVFGLIGGPPGVLVGGVLGGIGGDLLGGAFYDLIFRDNAVGRIADNISQSFVKKGVKTGISSGFMSGGFVPYGGRVHAGEFVIDADSTRAIERRSPGFLMALNKAKGSQVNEVLETYMSYGNEGEGSERLIPLPFEKVVTRTVVTNTGSKDDSSSPFMDLYRRG